PSFLVSRRLGLFDAVFDFAKGQWSLNATQQNPNDWVRYRLSSQPIVKANTGAREKIQQRLQRS
ncbi:MAG: hypothetical protein VX278_17105, partial [Myxococcota bacterium]|nr:hypothetical protein [Myxococcota bacterium]